MLSPLDTQSHYVQMTEYTHLLPANGAVQISVRPDEVAPQPATINQCTKRVSAALGSSSAKALAIMSMAIGSIVGAWDHPEAGLVLLGSGFGLLFVSAGFTRPAEVVNK